jgi:tRNA-2-methylthio-N6-dimethylallyladenosine synthase
VTTDVIVGFPGETEEDFEQTLRVVREARFDSAFTFQYSPRPGTPAGNFSEQVPKSVVQERFDRLVALQETISLERNRELVGADLELLIEGEGRKGNLSGRTRTNKLTHVAGSVPPGSFVRARISRAAPHHLIGELVPAA